MMLPNGWKKVKLGQIMSFKNGLNFSQVSNGKELNFLGVANFKSRKFISSETQLDKIYLADFPNDDYLLKANDLVFVRSNGSKDLVGRCVKMNNSFSKTTFSGFCIRGRLFSSETTADYILHFIESGFLKDKLRRESRGTNISNLNQDILDNFDIMLPPLEEQKKIAATLSVWDSAIEKMEKLIDAKENELNIVLRQNLLEKGIALKWKEIPLTEILKSVTPPSKIHQDSYLNSGKYPIVDQSKDLIAGWTNDESSVLKINRPLIIFGDHTCALKIMHMPFAQGADGIKILSVKDGYDPTYIYYAIKANPVIPEGYKRHFSALMLKSILCPSLEEQKKYAVYFKSLDEEIALLKQQLENYKKQKQGLMQKLLTGEWRVK